jgi:hypothetical protein
MGEKIMNGLSLSHRDGITIMTTRVARWEIAHEAWAAMYAGRARRRRTTGGIHNRRVVFDADCNKIFHVTKGPRK